MITPELDDIFEYEQEETQENDENTERLEYPALPPDYVDILNSQWRTFKKNHNPEPITSNEVKKAILKDLTFLSKLTVQEYTLYKKFAEIKEKYPYEIPESDEFFDCSEAVDEFGNYSDLIFLKKNIWVPESLDDYKNLKPIMIRYNDNNNHILKEVAGNEWNQLRVFIHTQLNNSNIGRNLNYIVLDEVTGKYLGIICVSSDFMDLTPRDKFIGWSRDIKTSQRMINHTAIGSTICPTQPLGYNYVGGKLLALLTASDVVEKDWYNQYKSKLAGVTTTSLYESYSQYTNLQYWIKMGKTAGSIKFECEKETIRKMMKWLEYYYPLKYWEWFIATEPGGMPLKRDNRQRSFSFIYSKLEIPEELIQANHARGIFFCPLFTNTPEFLRKEIDESRLVKRFDNSVESLTEIWKEKYASKRINQLKESNSVNLDTLFYGDLISTKTWNEVREKYIDQVGKGKIEAKQKEAERQKQIKLEKEQKVEQHKQIKKTYEEWLKTASPEQIAAADAKKLARNKKSS
jgi:hypothetical protein